MAKKIVETPLMKQYVEMKKKHPDAILLFRVGDFYETFSDDAIVASEILGITLTRRANGAAAYVELAGFPHHALESYLPRLVRAGRRVAICEQLEDPKQAKGLVKRGITELVTPGVATGDNVLNHRENNFLGAVHRGAGRKEEWGVAFLDISTGEFMCAQGTLDHVDKLLATFAPKEVLIERGTKRLMEESLTGHYLTFELDDWVFTHDAANERLLTQFGTRSLKGFGLNHMDQAVIAAGACMHYLDVTSHTHTRHITSLTRIEHDSYVRLDRFTIRNLELIQPLNEGGRSLLDIIDRTVTPMGARLLRSWVVMPLRDEKLINSRLDVVDFFFRNPDTRETVLESLERVGDLGRLTSKVSTLRITPRELLQVRAALDAIVPIRAQCLGSDEPVLVELGRRLDACEDVSARIAAQINPDAPSKVGGGDVIRRGVNAELDDLRDIAGSGKSYLAAIQEREAAATGISSLKIGFNNVFGYYIEVTNTHRDKVPAEWVRKQTLVNAERYITQELKEYEEKILTAQDRIASLETSLFNDLVAFVSGYMTAMQADAHMLAELDCLLSFTTVAANRYVRPVVDNTLVIELTDARHPVIERRLPPGEPYIANSLKIDNAGPQILMVTGPNMSGKSALLRQTALNVIMAQIGCYVAADAAHIGIVDKIFTRVGASDNISLGESTFMMEMTEAAAILNNLSERSLVLFDELGRGTSTYDGISIAWAIVEYIHQNAPGHPKTLFATHYHELNEMEKNFPRIANCHVAVKEIDGKVVFVRKLERGGSEHSFGIHVARLAGIPRPIVERANIVLETLESQHDTSADAVRGAVAVAPQSTAPAGMQLSFFQLDDPVLSQVRDEIIGLDINNLTPMEALNKLHDIRTIITGKS
ncbi:MAG: DNA mismatch repair protein MutS [Bacteroidales bacterium]|nr:DNA mismatch repair protein MutS [Bacteroidales bacterium]